jgi:hypothetical protein
MVIADPAARLLLPKSLTGGRRAVVGAAFRADAADQNADET